MKIFSLNPQMPNSINSWELATRRRWRRRWLWRWRRRSSERRVGNDKLRKRLRRWRWAMIIHMHTSCLGSITWIFIILYSALSNDDELRINLLIALWLRCTCCDRSTDAAAATSVRANFSVCARESVTAAATRLEGRTQTGCPLFVARCCCRVAVTTTAQTKWHSVRLPSRFKRSCACDRARQLLCTMREHTATPTLCWCAWWVRVCVYVYASARLLCAVLVVVAVTVVIAVVAVSATAAVRCLD